MQRLPLKASGAIPNLESCDDIWPTDTAPVLRLFGDGIELVLLRLGFAPGRPKAGLVINFRSEEHQEVWGARDSEVQSSLN